MTKNIANHSDQRVGIFIDTQNLYHSAKNKYHANVNYEEVIKAAVAGRKLIRAFAYVIKAENNDEGKFFDALTDIGIEIKIKDIQIFHTGEKKADWDVGIAVDIIRMTEKLDTVVLMSGDGDFVEVIKYVQSRGVRAEVMAFEKTGSSKLIEECDFFFDIGSDPESFLIGGYKKPRAPVTRRILASTAKTTSPIPASTSRYLRPASNYGTGKPTPTIHENIYGKKTTREIKPVVGTPMRKTYLPRTTPSATSPNKYSLENAFGNKPKPVKKPGTSSSGSSSSIFKF